MTADDAGNSFVFGSTGGTLDGVAGGDGWDAFVSKVDITGKLQWTRQVATPADDNSAGVAVDADGNIYLAGGTRGALARTPMGEDIFLRKFGKEGEVIWTRQWGSPVFDRVQAAKGDSVGNIFVSGYTQGSLGAVPNAGEDDAFLSKVNAEGTVVWTRQWGTAGDEFANSIAISAEGKIAVFGIVDVYQKDERDIYVRVFNPDGSLDWTHQWGSVSFQDEAQDAQFGKDGSLFVIGGTFGPLQGVGSSFGGRDAYLGKFNAKGTLLWTKQWGTEAHDTATGLDVDQEGNVYVVGTTGEALQGATLRSQDVFLRKFAADGSLGWTRQLGTAQTDDASGVRLAPGNTILIGGWTGGALSGVNAGQEDAFVMRVAN